MIEYTTSKIINNKLKPIKSAVKEFRMFSDKCRDLDVNADSNSYIIRVNV